MITQHLNKENTRWVFTPNSSPDIWTGAGYRKANNNNNGIPFEKVKPSNGSTTFNPSSVAPQPKKQPPIPFYPIPSVPPVTGSMHWLSLIRITRNEISCCSEAY
ncbi:MgPa adhesin [Mycoplasmoides genitalium M6282]|nr:MgPa adhesin [Mycoplasmoides genitalium M6282]